MGVRHRGKVVTLADGRRYLVHKDDSPGTQRGGQPAVVDVTHMSNKWKGGPNQRARMGTTVGDLVQPGGMNPNAFIDNSNGAQIPIIHL